MTGEGAPEPDRRPAGEPPEPPRPKRRRRRRRKPAGGTTTDRREQPASRSAAGQSTQAGRQRSGKDKVASNAERAGKSAAKAAGKGARDGSGKRARGGTRPSIPTKKEVSAGGVVYRHAADGIEVVLASRRTRRGDLAWGLAKGGVEEGETFERAAVREVREETGLVAEIEADLGDTKYMYVWEDVRIRKTVHFFLMRHVGGDTSDRDDEMEEIRWFPLERALKRSAYRGERDVLARAAEILE